MKKGKYFLIALAVLAALACLIPVLGTADPVQLYSPVYGIDPQNELVGRIAAGTDEEDFLSDFLTNGRISLTDGVKTGSRLVLWQGNRAVRELELVVCGDCNGDGAFNKSDIQAFQILRENHQAIPLVRKFAADINCDGELTDEDLVQMNTLVQQGLTPEAAPLVPLPDCTVLTPGQVFPFPGEALSVIGQAVNKADGGISAAQSGLAWVSSTDAAMLFLVTDQAQQITLPESARLGVRMDLQLNPKISIPVQTALTYTSSDPSIATVNENGLVTALSPGIVTITCAPTSGQAGQIQLQVLPLAESITLSAETLKIKNGKTKVLTATVLPADAEEPLIWSSSDPAIATVDENGVITGLQNGYVTITYTGQYSGVSASCQVKVCDLIQVALTFDDGPSDKYTAKVLDMLKKYDVPATFFMLGYRIKHDPDLAVRMAEEGHELGYHTWGHTQFASSSRSQIEKEFTRFQDLLQEICGQQATVFRAPAGRATSTAREVIALPHIYWTVDTRDWETRNTEAVKTAILNGLKDGNIILLHDIHATTYTGTLAALEYIFQNDLDVEFLTVTQILTRNGHELIPGKTYYNG